LASTTSLSFLLGTVFYKGSLPLLVFKIMLHIFLWPSLRHLPVCIRDGFAVSLFCMHIQTHTTYVTVAFGRRISVSAPTIWPSHNSAHLHVV